MSIPGKSSLSAAMQRPVVRDKHCDLNLIRVGTWNILNLEPSSIFQRRKKVIRQQLFRISADILLLQEVNSFTCLDEVLVGTLYEHYYRCFTTSPTDPHQPLESHNLVILSRFPIIRYSSVKHMLAPQPLYRRMTTTPPDADSVEITWERPVLVCEIQVGSAILHILNVHLKSRHPSVIRGQMDKRTKKWMSASGWAEGAFVSALKRLGQATETRMVVDDIFDEDIQARVLVAGDFNEEGDSVPVQAVEGNVLNTFNEELATRQLTPCAPPKSPGSHTLIHHGNPVILDHVLISRQLLSEFRGCEVHNESLSDHSVRFPTELNVEESDHAPVVAIFNIPLSEVNSEVSLVDSFAGVTEMDTTEKSTIQKNGPATSTTAAPLQGSGGGGGGGDVHPGQIYPIPLPSGRGILASSHRLAPPGSSLPAQTTHLGGSSWPPQLSHSMTAMEARHRAAQEAAAMASASREGGGGGEKEKEKGESHRRGNGGNLNPKNRATGRRDKGKGKTSTSIPIERPLQTVDDGMTAASEEVEMNEEDLFYG